ncbi:unnamed protein product [Parnassius mnemosyne]|uniref:THAP-type domain-containing protein n=2 Tax=Parnassius mnemosyne TaxID=213953 RepID=A0AAV1LCI4_9NEOP
MLKMCEVPYCKKIGAHQFPKNAEVKTMWLKAIRRQNFKPKKNSRLCRNHFLETDYQKTSIYTGNEHQHRYLKKTAVPSVFAWTTKAISQEGQAREERLLARNIKKALFEQAHTSAPISRPEDLNFAEEFCT